MKQPTLLEMLKAGLHFGHIPSKRHPKMKPFIFGVRSGVHIIDLEQTQHYLDKQLSFAKKLASQGGTILFVATKKQAQQFTKEAAEKCSMPYIHEHWIGGLLTNFPEIKKVIRRYNTLKKQYEDNAFDGVSKKDKVLLDREYEKLQHKVSGIATLTKVPDALFILDIKKEKTSLAEARKVQIPIIAVCDSNTNPELVTHPIPGNDDATKAIALIMELMSEAIAEGVTEFKQNEAAMVKKAEEVKKPAKNDKPKAEGKKSAEKVMEKKPSKKEETKKPARTAKVVQSAAMTAPDKSGKGE